MHLDKLDMECNRILFRWFDDRNTSILKLMTKISIIGLLPDYALSIETDLSKLKNVDKVEWLSGYIFIDEKFITQYRKGLINLNELLLKSIQDNIGA